MRNQTIVQIRKRFHREWLLIAVDKTDEATSTPVSGRLIAHSPHREDIYQILAKRPKAKKILLDYSEDSLPKGFVAAF